MTAPHVHIAERCAHSETRRYLCDHTLPWSQWRVRSVPCTPDFCPQAPPDTTDGIPGPIDRPPPVHKPERLTRVPERTYAHLVEAAMQHTGQEGEQAERTVNALLGPLKLAPPLGTYTTQHCTHIYFTLEGEWEWCAGDAAEHHNGVHVSANDTLWRAGEPRAVEARAWEQ